MSPGTTLLDAAKQIVTTTTVGDVEGAVGAALYVIIWVCTTMTALIVAAGFGIAIYERWRRK